MRSSARGIKDGKQMRYVYHLLDHYDGKHGVTAMARTTAYPASIIAQLILEGKVKERGVVPPERLGTNDELFQLIGSGLKSREIGISEEGIVGQVKTPMD